MLKKDTNNKKIEIKVIFSENKGANCGKNCQSKQVIQRIMREFPELNKKVRISYQCFNSIKLLKNFENFNDLLPIIKIDKKLFSLGEVPSIKKMLLYLLDRKPLV